MSGPIRIGVVGLAFGEHHVRTLANMPDVELAAVADRTGPRAEVIGARYGCRGFGTAEQMIAEAELDALSVCVSPRARAPILKAATDAGIALFVEKPWAAYGKHAAELAEICRANPAPVMCAFSFRFHPVVRRALELVKGELGSVRLGSGSYVFGWLPPADAWLWDPDNGGGFFNENSCHLFDVVCALAGRPVEVFAYGFRETDRPSEKAATVSMRFSSGATVTVALGAVGISAVSSFPSLELFTESGYLRLTGANHIWRRIEWSARGETEIHELDRPPEQLGRTRYTDAFEHFVSCVHDGRQPEASVADGVLMVRIADAVRESFRSGGPVAIAEEE